MKQLTADDLDDSVSGKAVKEAVARVKEADAKAERAALAFTLGRFPEYWQAEYDATMKRMEVRYAELSTATTTGPAEGRGPG